MGLDGCVSPTIILTKVVLPASVELVENYDKQQAEKNKQKVKKKIILTKVVLPAPFAPIKQTLELNVIFRLIPVNVSWSLPG